MPAKLGMSFCISLSAILLFSGCGNRTREEQTQFSAAATVELYGVRHPGTTVIPVSDTLCTAERVRRETTRRLDRERLLDTIRVVIDSSSNLLEVPRPLKALAGKEFSIAREAPVIEFGLIPAEPKFFTELNGRDVSGWWGNYAQSNYQPENGKFYAAVGDHGQLGACIYIVEYDPAKRRTRCLPEINRTLGRRENQFGDGIIHGWLDFYKSVSLPYPHLWFCTYWSRFPEPTESDYATGYDGGHILSCDPRTGDIVDYGAPLPRASWPYHRVDTRRGMLYAVGMNREFLAWDINARRVRWAGYPPAGIDWFNRAILLDEATGKAYTTNNFASDAERHLIRYDPSANRFTRLACHMPKDSRTGQYEPMRAQTRDRGPDGLFWGVTSAGQLFTFDPDREIIEDKGPCWPGDQRYTCSLERSPGGRYVYYAPQSYRDGSPVIQLDTKTGKKKALAFLVNHYYGKYGYIPAVSYSLKLDDTGERLFMVWNGAFMDLADDIDVSRFGHCSVMLLHIPESEREDDTF
ncbi:MAG: hypothetical protein ACYC9O_12835 [Candidatus Latescibacterota bacterium]